MIRRFINLFKKKVVKPEPIPVTADPVDAVIVKPKPKKSNTISCYTCGQGGTLHKAYLCDACWMSKRVDT